MYSVKKIKGLLLAGMIGFAGVLAGCGGGGAGGTTTAAPVISTASRLALATSANSVSSANTNAVTITATALSASNVLMAGQVVEFSTESGNIVSASTITDSNGSISATFSAGTAQLHNRTAIITAKVSGTAVEASIPIQISGSTLSSTATVTTLTTGTPVTLTALAKVSDGSVAANQALRFSIASSSTGSGTLSSATALTDGNGEASISLTGTAAGVVNVLIEWLDEPDGNTTLSTTRSFTVQQTGAAFEVTTPSSSPWAVNLNSSQNVTVSTPATINAVAVANVRYATTLGSWDATTNKVITVARTGLSDTRSFNAGSNSGNANIQIDALSATGTVLATSRYVFALSATSASANSISLQSNVTALAPSSGGTTSTAMLTATVRDSSLNAVGGASVLFELVNPTGSGELIDPVVVSTNSSGVAQSVFTAGTSTTQTSQIRASVVGIPAVTPSTISITVGGTAGSVAIGTSTKISSINSDTSYQLPTTVMVTDSNGNAVNGAVVSLSLWGVRYHKGVRLPDADGACPASVTFTHVNEDINENLVNDAGEDVDGPGNMNGIGTIDGSLWPPSPAAGSLPATVTTGSDGTATFNWIYLKEYANWITARLRASVLVQGSEATTTTTITLSASKEDVDDCVLPSSPFN